MPSLVGGKGGAARAAAGGVAAEVRDRGEEGDRRIGRAGATHGMSVAVFCENDGEQKRFRELVDTEQPGAADRIEIAVGLSCTGGSFGTPVAGPAAAGFNSQPRAGCLRPTANSPLAFGHHEIFHRYEQRRKVKKVIASPPGRQLPRSQDRRLRRPRGARHRPVHGDAPDHQGRQGRGISHAALRRERHAARAGRTHQPDPEIRRRVQRASDAVAARQRRLGEAEGEGRRSA